MRTAGSILILGAGAILAAAFGPAAMACEGTPGRDRLILEVENVRSNQGLMTASLYPGDPSQFLVKNGALRVWSVPAHAPETRMCIFLPGEGNYAVAIYQDENSNHRWDHKIFGHFEPFGFSDDPRILFSQPSYDSVKFTAHHGETAIRIRLEHR
ncbi:MAG: DUF2141 domain-containing protein [Caulobacteraceae bacterium]